MVDPAELPHFRQSPREDDHRGDHAKTVPILLYPNSQQDVLVTGATSASNRSSQAAYPKLLLDQQRAARARSAAALCSSAV
jgi:hypothetical protein